MGASELEHVLPTFRNDLLTTVNVLTVATRQGIRRLVMAASLEEPARCARYDPCAAAKWARGAHAQMFHRLYGTPVVMVRPMMACDPRQCAQKLIPYVTLALLRGRRQNFQRHRDVN